MLLSKFWFNEVSNGAVMKRTKEMFPSFLETDDDNKVCISNIKHVLGCIQMHPELLLAIKLSQSSLGISKIFKKIFLNDFCEFYIAYIFFYFPDHWADHVVLLGQNSVLTFCK